MLDELKAAGKDPFQLSSSDQKQLFSKWHELGSAATRQLAKRQLTWLRSMPQRHVIASDDPQAEALVVEKAISIAKF